MRHLPRIDWTDEDVGFFRMEVADFVFFNIGNGGDAVVVQNFCQLLRQMATVSGAGEIYNHSIRSFLGVF